MRDIMHIMGIMCRLGGKSFGGGDGDGRTDFVIVLWCFVVVWKENFEVDGCAKIYISRNAVKITCTLADV